MLLSFNEIVDSLLYTVYNLFQLSSMINSEIYLPKQLFFILVPSNIT